MKTLQPQQLIELDGYISPLSAAYVNVYLYFNIFLET